MAPTRAEAKVALCEAWNSLQCEKPVIGIEPDAVATVTGSSVGTFVGNPVGTGVGTSEGVKVRLMMCQMRRMGVKEFQRI